MRAGQDGQNSSRTVLWYTYQTGEDACSAFLCMGCIIYLDIHWCSTVLTLVNEPEGNNTYNEDLKLMFGRHSIRHLATKTVNTYWLFWYVTLFLFMSILKKKTWNCRVWDWISPVKQALVFQKFWIFLWYLNQHSGNLVQTYSNI